MTGWGHVESLAPPLRVRLDDTTLKLASNPHQESQYFSPYRPKQRLRRDCFVKNGLEATSQQKLATDGTSPELISTHTDSLQQSLLELAQLAHASLTHHCTHAQGGGGGSGNWELHVNQPNSSGILYNYLSIL